MSSEKTSETAADIAWDTMLDQQDAEGLQPLYEQVVRKAHQTISYYRKSKKWKRLSAQLIRFFAILLFSFAGLIPLLDATGIFASSAFELPESYVPVQIKEALEDNATTGIDSGQWAVLLAAVAAALISIDKFFGLASSWTRITLAELSIGRRLDRFLMDWALANASADEEEQKRPLERIQLLKEFSMDVSQIVEDETKVWVSEYEKALATLERSIKEREETKRPGSIQVKIQRGSKVQGVVRILMDGRKLQETAGDNFTIRSAPPGTHEVQAIGLDSTANQEIKVSQIVAVPSAGIAPITLKLS